MTKTQSRARGVKALTVNVARLGDALKSRGHHLKHADLIEVAAYAYGLRDGNALAAAQKEGRLDLARPALQERVGLTDGSEMLVLRHDTEAHAFAIAGGALKHLAHPVVASSSGRLFDLTGFDPDAKAAPAADHRTVELTIHTASIEHKHGTNTYAALSESGLDAKIAEYCRDSWDDVKQEDSPDPDTASDADLISYYFENIDEEYLDTSTETVTVEAAELRALITGSTTATASKTGVAKIDPRSRDAWRKDVAAERTDLGYGEWYQRQPKPKPPLQVTGTRQFQIDDLLLEALRESLGPDHALAPTVDALSRDIAENTPYGTAILNLPGSAVTDLLDRLKARLAFYGPTTHENFGQKIAIENLITQIESVEMPVYLTDEDGETINGTPELLDALGLAYENDDDGFSPLTKAEGRYADQRELSFRIGTVFTASTGLQRGRKYLMPVIKIWHDSDDDADNVANAEYIETRLVPELQPRIGALGGFVRAELDAEDDHHRILLAIPFEAAEACADMDAWTERLLAILEGHPETEIRNALDGTRLVQRQHRPCTPGDAIAFADDRNRAIKGTVITVEGEESPSPVLRPKNGDPAQGFEIAATQVVAVRVESIDGAIQDDLKVPVLETEADLGRWMTRRDAQRLKAGDKLISLTEGSGDVETDDDSDIDFVERDYAVGDWLTVESVEELGGSQGLAVTVTSRNGVCNTFDEGDDDGKYPFRAPYV